jgi:uncharacterized phage-like protein YoqJ
MILAATGHRPPKLGGYNIVTSAKLEQFATAYLLSLPEKPTQIISGMALGWDQAWASAGLALGIPLTAAVPFRGQEKVWPELSQLFYRGLLERATHIEYTPKGVYNANIAFAMRNEWMVDNCDRLVALWDGSNGGTANCVRYAKRVQRPYTNLWSQWATIQRRMK